MERHLDEVYKEMSPLERNRARRSATSTKSTTATGPRHGDYHLLASMLPIGNPGQENLSSPPADRCCRPPLARVEGQRKPLYTSYKLPLGKTRPASVFDTTAGDAYRYRRRYLSRPGPGGCISTSAAQLEQLATQGGGRGRS